MGFSYIPGLNTAFAALESIQKRLIMLGLLALTAFGSYALACSGYGPPGFADNIICGREGFWEALTQFFLAVAANQGAYFITPDTAAVEEIKDEKEAEKEAEKNAENDNPYIGN